LALFFDEGFPDSMSLSGLHAFISARGLPVIAFFALFLTDSEGIRSKILKIQKF